MAIPSVTKRSWGSFPSPLPRTSCWTNAAVQSSLPCGPYHLDLKDPDPVDLGQLMPLTMTPQISPEGHPMPPQWDQYPIAGPYKELQQEQGDYGHCQPVRPPSRKADGGTESPAILQGCRRGIRDHPEAKLDEPFKREWPKTCSGLSVRARRHATDIPFFLCLATGIPRWARVIPSKQERDTKVTNPPRIGTL